MSAPAHGVAFEVSINVCVCVCVCVLVSAPYPPAHTAPPLPIMETEVDPARPPEHFGSRVLKCAMVGLRPGSPRHLCLERLVGGRRTIHLQVGVPDALQLQLTAFQIISLMEPIPRAFKGSYLPSPNHRAPQEQRPFSRREKVDVS